MTTKVNDFVKVRGTNITGIVISREIQRENQPPYYMIPVVKIKLEDDSEMEYNESELSIIKFAEQQ